MWGLHPALKDSMLPLWQKGQLAFVPFAGTEDLTRSHFETQDSMESGMPVVGAGQRAARVRIGLSQSPGRRARRHGRAGRVHRWSADGHDAATSSCRTCRSKAPASAPFDDRQMALLSGMYAGTRFEPLIAEGFDLRKTVAEQAELMANGGMAGEMQAANRNALTAKGFELEARRMAGLMKDKFNIGFIDVGGWDTHVNQGNAQGQLATLLTSLGQGLAGFADQMGRAWNQTVVFVLSEFGRTFRENGTRGTDHGHGSVHWVLGGAVQRRPVRGRAGRGHAERRSIRIATFRCSPNTARMLGGIFRRMYSLDNTRIARVFPNAVPLELGLV